MSVFIIGLYDMHQTQGLPFELAINQCIKTGAPLSFIHELERAVWQGCTVEKFMSLLSEALLFTLLDKDKVLSIMNAYISQRETPTAFNYQIMKEAEC